MSTVGASWIVCLLFLLQNFHYNNGFLNWNAYNQIASKTQNLTNKAQNISSITSKKPMCQIQQHPCRASRHSHLFNLLQLHGKKGGHAFDAPLLTQSCSVMVSDREYIWMTLAAVTVKQFINGSHQTVLQSIKGIIDGSA